MSTIATTNRRVDYLNGERLPNITGIMLCALISLPIWAGILALLF